MIADAENGSLFSDPAFADVPLDKRRIRDIAFSGDGEPTTCPLFRESVELIAALKREADLEDAKIVLITNASRLAEPEVAAALAVMDQNNGEIWAKLDAGTEAYFRMINRSDLYLCQVTDNIIAAAQARPVVIQSLFTRVDDDGPDVGELRAYVGRLSEIIRAGGAVKYVQVYTVARRPAESYVTALTNDEVDHIVDLVRRIGLRAEPFYGPG
jgi:wyosine [tRNA(Phe)-imidazoG37] synthetase (radical SAM superfamily)